MEKVNANPYGIDIIGRQQTSGEVDYVQDGVLHKGANGAAILIESENDLEDLAAEYAPGSVAYTTGFKKMWQLSSDGEWVSVI